ncbi:ribosome biogenesis protein Nop16 [Cristinia sonorae]|uniref:Nucleolar protein 16 n=1 Tax=Cristinia sonorae TaxID=1940300 RepID=A0A8K0V039_9AGAR|nr:ribosome biogenesis protein Nop16 [Cristinia sonorae]
MANPRQRRKTRSGSHRAVRHSNHAKKNLKKQPPIRGPKVLQDAWDKHKTVRQNYEALGLLPTLNPNQSGGVEAGSKGGPSEHSMAQPAAPEAAKTIPKGHGRIVRDAEGNVVDVEMAEEEEAEEAAGFPEDVDISAQEEVTPWVSLGGGGAKEASHVVQTLEAMGKAEAPVPRRTSGGEHKLLRNLVARYGRDVDAMARDRKRNPAQQTAGQLRRAIQKAGGFEALSAASHT